MSSSSHALQWMSRARRQLAEHLRAGTSQVTTTPSGSSSSPQVHPSNPYESYFDDSRDQVALRAPHPMLPSMALPPGHAFARRHPDGTPLLVYRDKKDPSQLRALVNKCRHRGSQLIANHRPGQLNNIFETKKLKAPLLTCPYHAWTFDATNGALRKIPGHEKAFGLMDTSEFGLTPVTCTEQAGYIWVGGDALLQQGLWPGATEMHASLEPILHLPTATTSWETASTIIGYKEWTVQANWQLLVETALESYHVPSLHQQTFHLVTDPTEGTMVSEWKDSEHNVTMSVPLRNFELDDDNDERAVWTQQDTLRFLGETTTTHLIFPNAFSTFFKRFVMFITMQPADMMNQSISRNGTTTTTTSTSIAPSSSTLICAWALPHKCHDEDDLETQKRDFASVLAAVEEDWECTERIQEGLNDENKQQFIYGGYEGNNVKFLKNVGALAKKLQT